MSKLFEALEKVERQREAGGGPAVPVPIGPAAPEGGPSRRRPWLRAAVLGGLVLAAAGLTAAAAVLWWHPVVPGAAPERARPARPAAPPPVTAANPAAPLPGSAAGPSRGGEEATPAPPGTPAVSSKGTPPPLPAATALPSPYAGPAAAPEPAGGAARQASEPAVPADPGAWTRKALLQQAEEYRLAGRLRDAARLYRAYLAERPDPAVANNLAGVLILLGR
ncbi:hypothetical protein G3N55_05630, partial [Dissulfurirhabdus thermomarina]|nr:hypothetical protein [Dissulfurirhabdus thermomarina]